MLTVVGAAVVIVAGCQRTPEEPVTLSSNGGSPPPASTVVPPTRPSDTGRPIDPSRCVHATPSSPPPGVAPGPAARCPPDPAAAHLLLVSATVSFPDAGGVTVDAELARSEAQLMRGLMFRTHMAEDRGMLFRMGRREDHQFWMRNTCIPLDLLFVEDDGLIVGIVENAPTLNDEERGVGCPSTWVLEVNAGWTRRHGVRAGQRLTIPDEARRG